MIIYFDRQYFVPILVRRVHKLCRQVLGRRMTKEETTSAQFEIRTSQAHSQFR